jgi:hypothetical protein
MVETSAAGAPPAGNACGARLRDGSSCLRAPAPGKRRCRSHGGAPRVGAPIGNRNAYKTGEFTAPILQLRRRVSQFIRDCNATLKAIEERDRQR